MKTVQVVINIPQETYEYWKENKAEYVLAEAIANGTVLPEQYGDLIDRNELLKNDIGKIMGFRESDIRDAHTILEGTVKE